MNAEILRWFSCPFCLAAIRVQTVVKGSEQDLQHGLLNCSDCGFEYPVLGGVAILQGPDDVVDIKAETTAATTLKGPRIRDLVQLIKAGEPVRSLSLLLGPTSANGRLFPRLEVPGPDADGLSGLRDSHLKPVGRRIRLRHGGRILQTVRNLYRRKLLPSAQFRMARFLESHRRDLSALDVIDLYYRQYSGVETFNYFAFRFGQPRHLAGLSLASLLGRGEGPILDLACGTGHLTHFFTCAHPGRPVVGVDRDFFRLYVASQYVAPAGNYVCAQADLALPFSERAFAGIFCSDAFHYFLHRAASVRELQRLLAEDGILVLSRFGNVEVEPREGYELALEGYRRLFRGFPNVFLGEDDLVSRYLEKRGPNLTLEAPAESLRRQKWLSVVASLNPGKFHQEARFADWPHAAGRLQINPIYLADGGSQDGGLELKFQFPSEWYEFENQRYRDYAPARCSVTGEVLEALRRGERSRAMEDGINQFVILGMPERYRARKTGSPQVE